MERRVPDAPTRPRRDVYAELLVTVGLFAIPAALNAVYAYVASELHFGTAGIGWLFASRAAQELLLIGLFFYVLRANGERLADFTKPAQWGDVPRTVGLLLASWLPYVLVMAALWSWTPLLHQGPDKHGTVPQPLVGPVPRPAAREPVLRGAVDASLPADAAPTARLASAAHRPDERVGPGCVSPVYYQRARRVWPVVGVHLIADLSAGIAYSTLR